MGAKLKLSEDGSEVRFRCPGCGSVHILNVKDKLPVWSWNGSTKTPTFQPSVLAKGMMPNDDPDKFDDPKFDQPYVCHSFVKDGKIEFLGDCTHPSANKTLDLPDWE